MMKRKHMKKTIAVLLSASLAAGLCFSGMAAENESEGTAGQVTVGRTVPRKASRENFRASLRKGIKWETRLKNRTGTVRAKVRRRMEPGALAVHRRMETEGRAACREEHPAEAAWI